MKGDKGRGKWSTGKGTGLSEGEVLYYCRAPSEEAMRAPQPLPVLRMGSKYEIIIRLGTDPDSTHRYSSRRQKERISPPRRSPTSSSVVPLTENWSAFVDHSTISPAPVTVLRLVTLGLPDRSGSQTRTGRSSTDDAQW